MNPSFLFLLQNLTEATTEASHQKLITILSIALITTLALLTISLLKVKRLNKEIKTLKNDNNG
ncbi:hypothetical protein [Psychroserpens sp. NJDZ02]|uniref:hypothetical protein n=1 Tax=Psychroserpens sp. NJDZ02 TaxID=2570561 RepID=UPI0010A752A7|nr:hypothetical protein [Psychroserpens sp. NJDZ02]QCE42691.1 hypothetical protein E9099_15175 [Psychroserpens sp. NJDZ02]